MEKFTKEMVDKYADTLLVGLSEEENSMVLNEFEIIDKNIDVINNIPNINEVEPMSWCLDDFVVELRSDEAKESTDIKDLLKNCDESTDREVKVIKVVN